MLSHERFILDVVNCIWPWWWVSSWTRSPLVVGWSFHGDDPWRRVPVGTTSVVEETRLTMPRTMMKSELKMSGLMSWPRRCWSLAPWSSPSCCGAVRRTFAPKISERNKSHWKKKVKKLLDWVNQKVQLEVCSPVWRGKRTSCNWSTSGPRWHGYWRSSSFYRTRYRRTRQSNACDLDTAWPFLSSSFLGNLVVSRTVLSLIRLIDSIVWCSAKSQIARINIQLGNTFLDKMSPSPSSVRTFRTSSFETVDQEQCRLTLLPLLQS